MSEQIVPLMKTRARGLNNHLVHAHTHIQPLTHTQTQENKRTRTNTPGPTPQFGSGWKGGAGAQGWLRGPIRSHKTQPHTRKRTFTLHHPPSHSRTHEHTRQERTRTHTHTRTSAPGPIPQSGSGWRGGAGAQGWSRGPVRSRGNRQRSPLSSCASGMFYFVIGC